MPTKDPRIDAYIEKSKPFAKPILKKLRTIVHQACPGVEENIKWGMPAFEYKGPFCGMAAFKEHCVFGFWKASLLKSAEGTLQTKDRTAMGNMGRLTTVKELPSAKALATLVKEAAKLNESGVKVKRAVREKSPIKTPAYFTAALRKNKKALATWEAFSPSCKREYLEWVTEAKQEATRDRRLATTVEWLAQGKQRNWKYQK